MELLRKVAEFTTSKEDKKIIYIQYIRSILEQSCVVWHSSLSKENSQDLERVQKAAVRIIMGKDYKNYEDALDKIGLDSLIDRRESLSLRFAKKCVESENERCNEIFKHKQKPHTMKTRKEEYFTVKYANTERLKKSAVPYLQRLLNHSKSEIEKRKIKNETSERNIRRKPG